MASYHAAKLALLLSGAVLLSACDESGKVTLFQKKEGADNSATAPSSSTKLVERDVEAPDAFQVSDKGLWDGRPSLGGVWVAHDSTANPERVIIRNEANGKFVIGALFKRETTSPGPAVQVSSDAAAALGMLAGAPASLNITALRREEVPVADPAAETAVLDAAEPIEAVTLDDPIKAAAAALDKADAAKPPVITPAKPAAPKPAAAPKPTSRLDRPYIQIGIFSVESNAKNTADMLRKSGIIPTLKPGSTSGKKFFRVIVGPASNASERAALIKKIKGLGFGDAYAVTN